MTVGAMLAALQLLGDRQRLGRLGVAGQERRGLVLLGVGELAGQVEADRRDDDAPRRRRRPTCGAGGGEREELAHGTAGRGRRAEMLRTWHRGGSSRTGSRPHPGCPRGSDRRAIAGQQRAQLVGGRSPAAGRRSARRRTRRRGRRPARGPRAAAPRSSPPSPPASTRCGRSSCADDRGQRARRRRRRARPRASARGGSRAPGAGGRTRSGAGARSRAAAAGAPTACARSARSPVSAARRSSPSAALEPPDGIGVSSRSLRRATSCSWSSEVVKKPPLLGVGEALERSSSASARASANQRSSNVAS